MNARRYPRTLEGAFGPYHRSSQCPIQPMDTPLHPVDVLAVRLSALLLAVIVVAIVTVSIVWDAPSETDAYSLEQRVKADAIKSARVAAKEMK